MYSRKDRLNHKQKQKSIIKVAVILVLLLLSIGTLTIIVRHIILNAERVPKEVFYVKMSVWEDSISCRAIVVNQESIVRAAHDGILENLIIEGQKVRKSTLVGYLVNNQQKIPLYSPQSGIFTMQTDGLESIISDIDIHTAESGIFAYKPIAQKSKQKVLKDDVLYKIVDNLTPSHILIELPNSADIELNKGDRYKIRLDAEHFSNGKIVDFDRKEQCTYLLMAMEDFQSDFIHRRYTDIGFVSDVYYGSFIPLTALAKENAAKGVYCRKGESYYFKNVEPVKFIDDQVFVKGLEENVIVLSNSSQMH